MAEIIEIRTLAALGDIFAAGLMLLGSGFALVAAIGLIRLPDVYSRMHAATKAGVISGGFVLIALAVRAADLGVSVRAFALIVFLVLTSPVSAHLLARASYLSRVRLSKRSVRDDLFGKYDEESHRLDGIR